MRAFLKGPFLIWEKIKLNKFVNILQLINRIASLSNLVSLLERGWDEEPLIPLFPLIPFNSLIIPSQPLVACTSSVSKINILITFHVVAITLSHLLGAMTWAFVYFFPNSSSLVHFSPSSDLKSADWVAAERQPFRPHMWLEHVLLCRLANYYYLPPTILTRQHTVDISVYESDATCWDKLATTCCCCTTFWEVKLHHVTKFQLRCLLMSPAKLARGQFGVNHTGTACSARVYFDRVKQHSVETTAMTLSGPYKSNISVHESCCHILGSQIAAHYKIPVEMPPYIPCRAASGSVQGLLHRQSLLWWPSTVQRQLYIEDNDPDEVILKKNM